MNNYQMKISIDASDMYAFQIYHTYHSLNGVMSLILSVAAFAVVIFAHAKLEPFYIAAYIVAGVVFLLYYPVILKGKASLALSASPVLSHPLLYTFDEKGIMVTADEAAGVEASENSATLPWESVYKVAQTKDIILIYSNKINAYILPVSQISDLEGVKALIKEKLPDHRVVLK